METPESIVLGVHASDVDLTGEYVWQIEAGSASKSSPTLVRAYGKDYRNVCPVNVFLPLDSIKNQDAPIQVKLMKKTWVFSSAASEVKLPSTKSLAPFVSTSQGRIPGAAFAVAKLTADGLSTGIPSSPWALTVDDTHDAPQQLRVSFGRPVWNGKSDILHYIIQASSAENFEVYSEMTVTEANTTLVPTKFAVGKQTAFVRVCAVNSQGRSPWVQASYMCPAWPPGKMRPPVMKPYASDRLALHFIPVDCDNGSRVTRYMFFIVPTDFPYDGEMDKPHCNNHWDSFGAEGKLADMYKEKGVTFHLGSFDAQDAYSGANCFFYPFYTPGFMKAGVQYHVRVVAVNSEGTGVSSDPALFELATVGAE